MEPQEQNARYHRDSTFWQGKKMKFTLIIGMILLLLQVLFLSNMSYLLGAVYRSEERAHNIELLLVDYDGGVIGQALRTAYAQLQSPTFPTLQFADLSQFPSPNDLSPEVCHNIDIWGAIYIHQNASDRLLAALEGGLESGAYNSSDTFTYIVNEARYPLSVAVSVASLAASTLAAGTSQALATILSTQGINTTSAAALVAFAHPITATGSPIAHTPQAARALYNTAIIVLTIIPNMFFIMALNENQSTWQMFSKATIRANVSYRLTTSILYALSTAACATGYILAFREDWKVTAAQGVLTWLQFTLYCHIQFLIIDICTAFIPMSGIPFLVLFWIIANVTSTIYPFELSPGFYKWGYALPAHHHYQNLITIWSHGCAPQLYRTLPVLFSWWTVGLVVAVIGTVKRCKDAARIDPENKAFEPSELDRTQSRVSKNASSTAYGLPLPFQDALQLRPVRTTTF